MNSALKRKIAEILILSRYAEVTSCGLTDSEIQQFKDNAFNMYLGRIETEDDPYPCVTIDNNVFHAKVNRDLELILTAIDKYNEEVRHEANA